MGSGSCCEGLVLALAVLQSWRMDGENTQWVNVRLLCTVGVKYNFQRRCQQLTKKILVGVQKSEGLVPQKIACGPPGPFLPVPIQRWCAINAVGLRAWNNRENSPRISKSQGESAINHPTTISLPPSSTSTRDSLHSPSPLINLLSGMKPPLFHPPRKPPFASAGFGLLSSISHFSSSQTFPVATVNVAPLCLTMVSSANHIEKSDKFFDDTPAPSVHGEGGLYASRSTPR